MEHSSLQLLNGLTEKQGTTIATQSLPLLVEKLVTSLVIATVLVLLQGNPFVFLKVETTGIFG